MLGSALRQLVRRVTLSHAAVDVYDRFSPNLTLGEKGEKEAERYLLRLGMTIVARSYQDKFGEIDLIAIDDRTVVFVEVKTRSSDITGHPAEAVDDLKQKHLTKTAIGYLKWHKLTECSVRFDVIAIIWPPEIKRPQIVHYENAFEAVGEFQIF